MSIIDLFHPRSGRADGGCLDELCYVACESQANSYLRKRFQSEWSGRVSGFSGSFPAGRLILLSLPAGSRSKFLEDGNIVMKDKTNRSLRPDKQGLYDPKNEHDACLLPYRWKEMYNSFVTD